MGQGRSAIQRMPSCAAWEPAGIRKGAVGAGRVGSEP